MEPAKILLLLMVLLFLPPPVSADIYHWRDETGVDHYTNSPPPSGAEILLKEDVTKSGEENGGLSKVEEMEGDHLKKREALERELAETNRLLEENLERSKRSIEELHEKLSEYDRQAAAAESRIEEQRGASIERVPESRVEVYVEREYIPFFVDEDRRFGKRNFKKHRDARNPESIPDEKGSEKRHRKKQEDSPGLSLQEESRLRHASGIHTNRRLF